MGESGFGVTGDEEDSAGREHGFGYGFRRMVRRASEEVMSDGGAIGRSPWGPCGTHDAGAEGDHGGVGP